MSQPALPPPALDDPALMLHLQELAPALATAQDSGQLCALLWQLQEILQIDAAVFLFCAQCGERYQAYRSLLASLLPWGQLYERHGWHTNDPCLLYARSHTQPCLIRDLSFRSHGQKRLRLTALKAGCRGGVIVPAHAPEGMNRMGLLYLLCADPARFNARNLAQSGWLLQGLSAQLLDWWVRHERAEWRAHLALQPPDVELLRLTHEGFSSKEIARLGPYSKAAIDQRLSRTSRQFGTRSRKAAAQMAFQLGLI